MKKFRFLSWLLCLSMLFATLTVPGTAALADDATGNDNGMNFTKTATDNGDGTYTITLEAYATGSKIISEVTKDIPTDIILVLDQSGSMDNYIGTVSFKAYNDQRNSNLYDKRHNNGGSSNLWHKLEDGSYVSVSVTKREVITTATKITDGRNNSKYDNATNYWDNRNNLYALVNGEYQKVTVERTDWNGTYTYTYTLSDGMVIASSRGWWESPTFTGIDGGVLYLVTSIDNAKTVYTYTYTDSKGTVQTIGTSTGDNTVFSPALYQRSTNTQGGGSRLAAIKSAATTFVNAVAAKAAGADGNINTTDDVNHRIAVVGFASQSGYGNNTELLSISGQNSGNVGVAYDNITDQNLKDVMQNMNTSAGQTMVSKAIDALAANGGTEIDLGMDMAERILNANPVSGNEKRNRVVIVFTDGSPTAARGFQKQVARDAISKANSIKDGGTTVYAIGVFSGADATSAGEEPSGDLGENSSSLTAACNWFMQEVSSNNGTPQRPSYYLSASDSASLNNIFKQISDQIETGGTSSTLKEDAVVKDIISKYFTLPEGANKDSITLETWACTGKDGDEYTWTKNETAMGAIASISEDGQEVSVTGFNFSDNYVGTVTEGEKVTYRGHKLVISFVVEPKKEFLGGNNVVTNGTDSGIYDGDGNLVGKFDVPKADVTIKEPEITLPDANVYLGAYYKDTIDAEDLKNGTTIKFGDKIELDLSKPNDNWGLEEWQTEYVTIDVKITDEEGNEITDTNNLEMIGDRQYTVTVTVKPKYEGTQTAQTGKDEGTIHVFTPELTFRDSEVSYMASIAEYDYNKEDYVETKWRHQDAADETPRYSTDEGVTMLGNVRPPELTYEYTPDAARLTANNEVKATDYVPVTVTVKLGNTDVTDKTTFVHQCTVTVDGGCQWNDATMKNGNPAFLLHVKDVYADLTITKSGANTVVDPDQSFLFTVTGSDGYTTEVIIVGNGSVTLKNLKIGEYTVTEDPNWSWRYTPDKTSELIKLEANKDNTVTIHNTREKDQWLDGNTSVDNKFTGTTAKAD